MLMQRKLWLIHFVSIFRWICSVEYDLPNTFPSMRRGYSASRLDCKLSQCCVRTALVLLHSFSFIPSFNEYLLEGISDSLYDKFSTLWSQVHSFHYLLYQEPPPHFLFCKSWSYMYLHDNFFKNFFQKHCLGSLSDNIINSSKLIS